MSHSGELSIQGKVLKKGDEEYEATRGRNYAQNAHNRHGHATKDSGCHPAYIAIVETVEDIQACIHFAASHKLTVTVRTGGHNWFGCFLRDNCFMIDMSKFNKLEIDAAAKTATVGPAVEGTALNEAAAEHNLCFSSGHCAGVPLGGFLLGGGLGWFMPHYGLAAESVLEATIVTPTGIVVTATSSSEEDWMYMVRGSGSAFPGVVVSYKLQLATLPKIVRIRMDFYPLEQFQNVRKAIDNHVANHPDLIKKCELTLVLASTPPPLAGHLEASKVLMFMSAFLADTEEEFKKCTEALATSLADAAEPYIAGQYEDKSFKALSVDLSAGFPPGQHWIARALMFESKSMGTINWESFSQCFTEEAPLGLSHAMVVWSPEKKTGAPGSYGDYSVKGFVVLVLGAHAPDEDSSAPTAYVEEMMDILDPHVWKYDVLEHPLNKDTFHKTFLDQSDKILELRSKLDPYRMFFDPSTAEPNH